PCCPGHDLPCTGPGAGARRPYCVVHTLYIMGLELVVVDTLRGGAAVFIACLGVAWVLVFLSRLLAWPWWQLAQERARLQALSTASPLQILYDHADPQGRYARNLGSAFKYWVGVHNRSPDNRTLCDVTLRALESEFTSEVLSIAHRQDSEREPVLMHWDAIHPGMTEMVELFGLSSDLSHLTEEAFSGGAPRFTLEARAQDPGTVTAEFEFHPELRPPLRRVR